MQVDTGIREVVKCQAQGSHSECGFYFEQHHSARGEPVRCDLEEAAIDIKSVYAAIEGEGGFAAKDGKLLQGFGGNVRQVGADEIEVTVGGQRVHVLGEQVTLQKVDAMMHVEFAGVVFCHFERGK